MLDAIATLLLLVGLELVLGIDNILVISIVVGRLPEASRERARKLGLVLALVARILMLGLIVYLANMSEPIVGSFSVRDLILLAGGLFLIYKAVSEMHHTIELKEEAGSGHVTQSSVFAKAITQIILLDIVFSVDSVLTAVGLTDQLWVIVGAVVVSFAIVLAFAKQVGDFIMRHAGVKILALAFLLTIGVTLVLEGMHHHFPRAYIYLPLGFALFVQLLQMRYSHNRKSAADRSA